MLARGRSLIKGAGEPWDGLGAVITSRARVHIPAQLRVMHNLLRRNSWDELSVLSRATIFAGEELLRNIVAVMASGARQHIIVGVTGQQSAIQEAIEGIAKDFFRCGAELADEARSGDSEEL